MTSSPAPFQACSIYKTSKFHCVITNSGYRSRINDYQSGCVCLDGIFSDSVLAEAVLSSSERSKFLHPLEDEEFFKKENIKKSYENWVETMMETYSYKTRTSMFKGMLFCSFEMSTDIITISPSRRIRGEGFEPTLRGALDDVVREKGRNMEDIGAALQLALSRCIG